MDLESKIKELSEKRAALIIELQGLSAKYNEIQAQLHGVSGAIIEFRKLAEESAKSE